MINLGFELGLYAMKRLIKLRLRQGAKLEDVYMEILDMDVKDKTKKFYEILQKKV